MSQRPAVSAVKKAHFKIATGSSGNSSLNILVPGTCLVLFKTRDCQICKQVEPNFFRLAQQDRRVDVYAICDLTDDGEKDIARMSMKTASPITTVPLIIIYSDGTPIARQAGRKTIEEMGAFVSRALEEIRAKATTPLQLQRSGPQPPAAVAQMAKNRQPEFGTVPQVQQRGGRSSAGYMVFGGGESDEQKLKIPDVTPHNAPWTATTYRKMGD